MTHAGRSVIVSGSTVAIGLLSMVILPLPFIRSIGIGGMLIPRGLGDRRRSRCCRRCSSLLGPRINRLRVMPKRFVEPPSAEHRVLGALGAHRDAPAAADLPRSASSIVALVVYPGVPHQPERRAAEERAGLGRRRRPAAPRSPRRASRTGVYLPYIVLAEGGATARALDDGRGGGRRRRRASTARPRRRRGGRDDIGLVEAFGNDDGSSRAAKKTISAPPRQRPPAHGLGARRGTQLTLGGAAPEARDFISAVYGKFPYVLLFVLILTFVLLMRAFRSVVLPLKAVILNLVSLGAAYGIVVFIFQDGHGSDRSGTSRRPTRSSRGSR